MGEKDRPAQSPEPSRGRASSVQLCNGSASTKQDLCKTVIATSSISLCPSPGFASLSLRGLMRHVFPLFEGLISDPVLATRKVEIRLPVKGN